MTSLLAPYLYACCEVVLGVRDIKSRWWALSELAFNPHAEAPTSGAVWERVILSWRKPSATIEGADANARAAHGLWSASFAMRSIAIDARERDVLQAAGADFAMRRYWERCD